MWVYFIKDFVTDIKAHLTLVLSFLSFSGGKLIASVFKLDDLANHHYILSNYKTYRYTGVITDRKVSISFRTLLNQIQR